MSDVSLLSNQSNIDFSYAFAQVRAARLRRHSGRRIRPPRVLDNLEWPPNYIEVLAWRQVQLAQMELDPSLGDCAKAYYAIHPVEFIVHWCDTFDPRLVGTDKPAWMPFVLFRRQEQLVAFILECLKENEPGLVEKCRTMGATWVCVAISVWLWLFHPGATIGWGSQNAPSVDRIGDSKSIFEKIRGLIDRLPGFFKPTGLDPTYHLKQFVCYNPANGSSIVGEVGDAIGRSGRSTLFFKDEAQPLDAKILTPDGWRFMSDMELGCLVTGPDGLPHRVTQVKDCGVHDVYRIVFSDGTWTECSPNHLWTVDKIWGSKRRLTLRTHKLAQDYVYENKGYKSYKYRLPVCQPVEFASRGSLPLDPYLVGALLGDGSVKSVIPNSGSPGFCSADQEIIDSFIKLLPIDCVITNCQGHNYRIVDSRGRRCRWTGSRARQLILSTGIAGHGAATKFIPAAYKFASIKDRISILQGLLDTDGSASGGVVSYHTASAKLADDVLFLVQSLGGTATHNIKPAPNGYLDMHVLHLALPKEITPFRLTRNQALLGPRKHPFGRTIISMSIVGRKPVRCISVDSKEGLYLTDSCIVTHNSSHYEHAELIEASLSENTRVPIDISSVSGPGTLFHRKREAGIDWYPGAKIEPGFTRVFVMDWSDHPEYDQKWYDLKRAAAERNGTLHIFAQEIERNYAASQQGVIIPPDWVRAAIDAHKVLGLDDDGMWGAGLDVGDSEDGDRNALAVRKGIVLKICEEWVARDPGVTARRAISALVPYAPIELNYDCIGVGSNVKSEGNRLQDDNVLPRGVKLIPWHAGAKVLNPQERVNADDGQSPTNRNFFENLKAQGWWELRNRFFRTWRAIEAHKEGRSENYDSSTLIALDSRLPLLRKIEKELSQATAGKSSKLKMLVNKTPPGARSPNLADAIVMAYWPLHSMSMYNNDVLLELPIMG